MKMLRLGVTILAVLGVLTSSSVLAAPGKRELPVIMEHHRELAQRVLETVPLVDGHNDWPMNMRELVDNQLALVDFRQNLTLDPVWGHSVCDTCRTDIPRLRAGMMGAEFLVAYVSCNTQYKDAAEQTFEQIDVILRLIQNYSDHFQLVTTAQGILDTFAAGKIGSLIGVEGGHSIDNRMALLRLQYQLGARYMTFTHTCVTPWADASPVDKPGGEPVHDGITEFGKMLVREMNRLGMIIDLSHTSHQTQLDVIAESRAPAVFTHSGAFSICDSHRNVHDDVLQLVNQTNGIVMVTFYNHHVACTATATMADVIANINYIRRVAGVDHVGIGSDFDGIEVQPEGLEDVSHFPDLFAALAADPLEPWTEEELQKLAGLNFIRVFTEVERIRDEMVAEGIPPYEGLIPEEDLGTNTQCLTPDAFVSKLSKHSCL